MPHKTAQWRNYHFSIRGTPESAQILHEIKHFIITINSQWPLGICYNVSNDSFLAFATKWKDVL